MLGRCGALRQELDDQRVHQRAAFGEEAVRGSLPLHCVFLEDDPIPPTLSRLNPASFPSRVRMSPRPAPSILIARVSRFRGSGASERTKFSTCSETSTLVVAIETGDVSKPGLARFVGADRLHGMRVAHNFQVSMIASIRSREIR